MSKEAVECTICGLDGGSVQACLTCKGNAPNRPKQYTLSEIRAGKTKDIEENRYESLRPKNSDPLWSGAE